MRKRLNRPRESQWLAQTLTTSTRDSSDGPRTHWIYGSDSVGNTCWNCGGDAPRPLGLPCARYDDGTFLVEGVFCGVACTKRWNIDHPSYRSGLYALYLRELQFKVAGSREYIAPAPPREALQDRGGPLTPAEYRGCGEHMEVFSEPYVSFPKVLEVAPSRQFANVTGLRRPVQRRITAGSDADGSETPITGGRLHELRMSEAAEETKEAAAPATPPRPARRARREGGGGLTAFARRRKKQ